MTAAPDSAYDYPETVEAILKLDDVPVVAINQDGMFTYVSQKFQDEYGWTPEDLLDKPVTFIMPEHLRDAHSVGLSRYLTTEKSTLLNKPLPLDVQFKDGRVTSSIHYIVGDKVKDKWRFAAIIMPANR